MKRVIKYRKHDLCQAHINKNFRFSALLTAINSITRKRKKCNAHNWEFFSD